MWILAALVSFASAVVLHGVAMRVPLGLDSVRRFLLVGIPLGGTLVVFSGITFGVTTHGLASILLYALLSELYIFCFTLVLSSVSVTMLISLRRGPVAPSAFASIYDPRGMVTLRLDRLIKQGLLARQEERIFLTARGKRLHRAFGALQRFFRHNSR